MKFTKEEMDTAVRVMANSRQVKAWVKSELLFLHVDLENDAGKKQFSNSCYKMAKRLLKQ